MYKVVTQGKAVCVLGDPVDEIAPALLEDISVEKRLLSALAVREDVVAGLRAIVCQTREADSDEAFLNDE